MSQAGMINIGGSSGAILDIEVDAATPPGTDPVLPDGTGTINITGGQVATGTTANVIRTHSTAANSLTIEVQRSTTAAATDVTLNGVSHFNSTDFTVDANGFVSLVGSSALEFVTDVNSPAVPVANVLNVVGGSSTVDNTNGIRTDGGSGSDTLTIQLTNRVFGGTGTNDGTPTTLITFGLGATPGTYIFNVQVAAYNVGAPASAGYNIFGTCRTDGITATLVGTPDKIVNEEASMALCDANMIVSGNNMIIEVTGLGGNNIDWQCLGNYTFVD